MAVNSWLNVCSWWINMTYAIFLGDSEGSCMPANTAGQQQWRVMLATSILAAQKGRPTMQPLHKAIQNCLAGAVAAVHSRKETIPCLYIWQPNFHFHIFTCLNKNIIEHLWNLICVYIIHMFLFSSKPTPKNYQFCKIWFKVHHHLGSREGNVKWVCCWRIQSMIIWKYFLSSCMLCVVHFIDSVESLYTIRLAHTWMLKRKASCSAIATIQ